MSKIVFSLPNSLIEDLLKTIAKLDVHKTDATPLAEAECDFMEDDINGYSKDCVALVKKALTPNKSDITTEIAVGLDELDAFLAGITNLRFAIVDTELLDIPEGWLDGSEKPDHTHPLYLTHAHTLGTYRFLSLLLEMLIDAESKLQSSFEDPEPPDEV